jgi:membrane-associated phospholipid phosphatase
MLSTIKRNAWFLIPYTIVALISLIVLLVYTKADIHLYLNAYYNDFGDFFFKYLTILGDGIFIPFLAIILTFIRFRHAFYLVLTYAISGLFTQLLKRAFFWHVPRPTKFFEGIAQLHLVPGVEQLGMKSFPSGHSTTAFAIMICFAIIVRNNFAKLVFFILATLVAYSRVYLSQHFLVDILTGSFIGTLTGLLLNRYIASLKWNWLDKNILELRKSS